MNAFVIDAFEFCRLKDRREGEIAVVDLPRLAEESVDKAGAVRWALQGGNTRQGHPQLTLSVSGTVRLTCQRCLGPFDFSFASESVLVLAPDERGADEIDAQLADESMEVIVGSSNFDIAQVIEDEALLAIPLSPKHDACPEHLVSATEKDAEKVSPFAVLKNLKR
jgi:uncharacterized protein